MYNRHRRWSGDGTWEMILDGLRAGCDEEEGAAWTVGRMRRWSGRTSTRPGRGMPRRPTSPAERLAVAVLSVPVRTGG